MVCIELLVFPGDFILLIESEDKKCENKTKQYVKRVTDLFIVLNRVVALLAELSFETNRLDATPKTDLI